MFVWADRRLVVKFVDSFVSRLGVRSVDRRTVKRMMMQIVMLLFELIRVVRDSFAFEMRSIFEAIRLFGGSQFRCCSHLQL